MSDSTDKGRSKCHPHVLVVDDDRLGAEAIASLMEIHRPNWRTSACCSAQRALGMLDGGIPVDLVLVEIDLPELSGMELLAALGERCSSARTVLMGTHIDDGITHAVIKRGAAACVSKSLPVALFLARLDEVIARPVKRLHIEAMSSRYTCGRSPPAVPSAPSFRKITLCSRQRQVLALMTRGHSNKRIATVLDIGEATVKYHTTRLFSALGVRCRTACVWEARRRGLVKDEALSSRPVTERPSPSSVNGERSLASPHAIAPKSEGDGSEEGAFGTLGPSRLTSVQTLVGAPSRRTLDDIVHLASTILSAPTALITIMDRARDRQCFIAQVGVSEPWATRRQTPLSHSFCRHALALGATFLVRDARTHPIVRTNPAIEALGVIAYLGVPLRTLCGDSLGVLCVIDSRPRRWSKAHVAELERLARCASDAITLHAMQLVG